MEKLLNEIIQLLRKCNNEELYIILQFVKGLHRD